MVRNIVAGIVLAAAAFIASPAAHADDVTTYLDSLHDQGIGAEDGDAILVVAGQSVCDMIEKGRTPMQVARWVYRNTNTSIDAHDSGFIVGAAIANLCPENL